MLGHHTIQSIVSKFPLFQVSLIVSWGLTATNPSFVLAANLAKSPLQQLPTVEETFSVANGATSSASSPLAEGIYLYGQSAQAEQIGQEYLVFQVRRGKVVGAIYFPQSEFNCFYGTIDSRELKLAIVDPYDNNTYPYAIALRELSSVAEAGERVRRAVGLEGYEQIESISENDRRILNVCLEQHK